jgi:hypothetical protein
MGAASMSDKISKASANYRHPPAKATKVCGNCSMFRKPGTCTLVEGTIDPKAVCRFWERADKRTP